MTAVPGALYAYYRMELPLRELARHDGYEVTFADAGDQASGTPRVTLSDLAGHDIIVAQRWNKHSGLHVWRRARTPFSRLVYELDDDLWSITPENWAAYQLYNRPDIRDAVEHACQTADLVTVSTEPLAAVLRGFTDNVVVCPNCVPGWATELPHTLHPRPRVGWQGGASHGVDIGLVAGSVRRFLRRFGDWDLQIGGTDYRDTFKAPADRAFYSPWVQINSEPEKYFESINFDIGLAPLAPTTFASSKSNVKILEYGARGIPSIASDCPAYRDTIEHGVSGFLIKRDHEWLHYMSELASDDALREKMGIAAHDMARRHLIEDHWVRWRDAYEGLFPHGIP